MIKTFADRRTAAIHAGILPKGVPADLAGRARRKLAIIDHSASLEALRVPPGNRLEALKGDRLGQHSLRVNDQWRLCFVWRDGDAYEVEFTDYHAG